MAYRPITEPSQLPQAGLPLPEDLRFDMKLLIGGLAADEGALASDVAAFANTAGGILLIGAHEHPKDSGILNAYRPMLYAEAQKIGETLKRALALCSPKPIAESKPIGLSDGSGYVVAINCDPYGAPPIGVAQPGQGGGEKWWAFPTRRGRDTHNLRPEELATIMEPRLRRMLLLLNQIPAPVDRPASARFHSTSGQIKMFYIVSTDAEGSALRLRNTQNPQEVTIPLDCVRMIWRERDGELHHVALDGSIVETSTGELVFQL
jgi:hypothetical protein